jgi:hypothetical protein
MALDYAKALKDYGWDNLVNAIQANPDYQYQQQKDQPGTVYVDIPGIGPVSLDSNGRINALDMDSEMAYRRTGNAPVYNTIWDGRNQETGAYNGSDPATYQVSHGGISPSTLAMLAAAGITAGTLSGWGAGFGGAEAGAGAGLGGAEAGAAGAGTFTGGMPASSFFPAIEQGAGNYALGSGMFTAGAADAPLILGTAGEIGTGLGMATPGLMGLQEAALLAGSAGAAGAAAGSSGAGTAGTSASGGGEVASNAVNPYANEVTRLANTTSGINSTDLPFTPTSSGNAFSDYLGQANDFLKSPVGQIGSSLISGALSNRAASNAADAQRAALDAGIAEQRRESEQIRTDLAPYRERGYQANNRLAMMMGLAPNAATYKGNMATYQQDPVFGSGYQSAPQYQPSESANTLRRYLKPLSQGIR